MEGLTQFKKTGSRFLNSLFSSIECFRKGEDHSGMDYFLNSINDLEALLESCKLSGKLNGNLGKMIPAVQELHVYMQNQDMAGMTDLLEFTLYPMAKEWIEECDEE